jgi:hypothetical protein
MRNTLCIGQNNILKVEIWREFTSEKNTGIVHIDPKKRKKEKKS